MARLKVTTERPEVQTPGHVGKILVFCEGETEENYFAYFKEVFKHREFKFSDIVIETVPSHGNAKTVLNRANEFFSDDLNVKKYQDFRKFLVFDCDAPDDIQEVINSAIASKMNYHLLLSNLLFETWLVMHFLEVDTALGKRITYQTMADYYGIEKYDSAAKANAGLLRGLISDGMPVRKAIANAEALEKKWQEAGKCIDACIIDMNPFTLMHHLVQEIMDELQYASP